METAELGAVGGVPVLAVHGDVDLRTVPALHEAVTDALADRPPRLLVDLSDVTFLDSAGLKVFDDMLRRTAAWDGQVGLVCPQPHLVRLLEITGLDTVFPLYPTVAEAVAAGD